MWVPSWNPTEVVPNGTIRTVTVSGHTHLVWRKCKEAEVLIYHVSCHEQPACWADVPVIVRKHLLKPDVEANQH